MCCSGDRDIAGGATVDADGEGCRRRTKVAGGREEEEFKCEGVVGRSGNLMGGSRGWGRVVGGRDSGI